ncbi:uncharacterized protein [Clytia hemisphaerica]|uniref:Uncharacterized protein n=1 Tax=Clytia hemisphaerica TaxID=252671 RepID=A0A7M5V8R7_9CNID
MVFQQVKENWIKTFIWWLMFGLLTNGIEVLSTKCKKKIPPNNHGVMPQTIIQEEVLTVGNLKGVIPVISPEYIVQFTFKLNSVNTVDPTKIWCSLIHFTEGENIGAPGTRIPGVYIHSGDATTTTGLAIHGNVPTMLAYSKYDIQMNKAYDVEIRQRYVSGGLYRYSVSVDGIEEQYHNNFNATQFYDVKIYAGDPWHPVCDGTVSHLKITNFL